MRSAQGCHKVVLFLCLELIPLSAYGQDAGVPSRYGGVGGPFTPTAVRDAPFSADATLTFLRTLADSTRIEQRVLARYYRDSSGRVRAEWVDVGLGDRSAGRYTSIWIAPYPGQAETFVLDPSDQTFRLLPRSIAARVFSAGNAFTIPSGRDMYPYFFDFRDWGTLSQMAIGERRIEGLDTVGQRTTIASPDQPEPGLVEERWESPELSLVIYSKAVDAHASVYGSVEYRLTNINRTEPSPELFLEPKKIVFGADQNPNHAVIGFGGGPCGCVVR